jgi:hypothetical protein
VASAATRSSHDYADLRFLAKRYMRPSAKKGPGTLRHRPHAGHEMLHPMQLRAFSLARQRCASDRESGTGRSAQLESERAGSWRARKDGAERGAPQLLETAFDH